MPQGHPLDLEVLGARLERHLAGRPLARAAELASHLEISRSALSRLLRHGGDRLLVVGRGRASRYAVRRAIGGAGTKSPVYEVSESGTTRLVATLHAVEPGGFYVESHCDEITSRLHPDLPYFLHDLRPAGYLGRLLPRRHPDLGLPSEIQYWSGDHCLQYLTRYGSNMPGNLVVGDRALEAHLEESREPEDRVEQDERVRLYPILAADALASGTVGSSAAGEHPKFLATLMPQETAVLVKFSPPLGNAIARRTADLLVVEHLVHELLRSVERDAARSRLVVTSERLYLEVERFDRIAGVGRRGVLSMLAVDSELTGSLTSWSDTAETLARGGKINADACEQIRWLELFGKLIANTDMHFGNLSLFHRGEHLLGLAPVYDMLPMFYASVHGNLSTASYPPPAPRVADADIWESAHAAAVELWSRVAGDERVSDGFRAIARDNLEPLERWAEGAIRLPR